MFVLAPAGLENYFAEVADALQVGLLTWELEQDIAQKYGQEFLDKLKHWGHNTPLLFMERFMLGRAAQ